MGLFLHQPRQPRPRLGNAASTRSGLRAARVLVAFLAASLVALTAPVARAADYHWSGSLPISPNWDLFPNWVEGVVPPNNGTAITYFEDIVPGGHHSPNVPFAWSIQGLWFEDDVTYIIGGSQLTIGSDGITLTNPFSQTGANHALTTPIRLAVDQTWRNVSSGALTVAGAVNLNGNDLTVFNTAGAAVGITGVISGAGSLTKDYAGPLTLTAANTYVGPTTVRGGTLRTGANHVIPPGTFTLDDGLLNLTGYAEAIGPGAVVADGLRIGAGPGTQATVLSPTFPLVISTLGIFVNCYGQIPSFITGKLELGTSSATRTFAVDDNPSIDEELVISADITNATGVAGPDPVIRKLYAGTMTLSGANNFIRQVQVQQGGLRVGSNTALGAAGVGNETTVENLGYLELAPGVQITGENLLLLGDRPEGALRSLGGQTRWDGTVLGLSGISTTVLVAAGELTVNQLQHGFGVMDKKGPGVLVLDGATSSTGQINMQEGTLRLENTSGSATGSGLILLGSGTRLEGSGSAAGLATANPGATVAPGGSPGTLRVGQLQMYGTLEIEIQGTNPGVDYDQLLVTNDADIGEGTLQVTSGFAFAAGQEFTVMTYGSREGTFATVNLPALPPYYYWTYDYDPNALVLRVQTTLDVETRAPLRTVLHAPAPNPAFRGTVLRYELSRPGVVALTIHDLQGRRVASLVDGELHQPGPYEFPWDGRDDGGRAVPAGTYVARLWHDGSPVGNSQKIALLR